MKHIYLLCFFSLSCIAGISQTKRPQSISLGLQFPASKIFDPVTGENLMPIPFPLTAGYSITLKQNHVIGVVAGGRWKNSLTLQGNADSVIFPAFWGIEARADYRWFFMGTNQVLQPFIGGGMKTATFFYDEGLPRDQFTSVALQSILGLQVKLFDRFYIKTEIPVTLWQSNGIAFWNIPQLAGNPALAISSFFRAQRNQLWPVISVGIKL